MTDHETALTLHAGHTLPGDAWHDAFTAAFADYLIGPFVLGLSQWPGFLARQGVDLQLSRAACDAGGRITAFALVAPRDARRRWRLATMGARPEARGQGVAPALLDDFMARASAAGAEAVELEVFAANERALRLYRSRGFEAVHPLFGHEHHAAAQARAGAPGMREVPLAAAWEWLEEADARLPDLPLQVTAAVLRTAAAAAPPSHPVRAWRCGTAQLVFGELPAPGAVMIHSLVDLDAGQQSAEALVRAWAARFPGRTLRVPALQRPDLGGRALERAGFLPQPLHQWLMRRRLG